MSQLQTHRPPNSEKEKGTLQVDQYLHDQVIREMEVDELPSQSQVDPATDHLFLVQSASKWLEQANTRPIPLMLFGELWFEGELCIFFADTNLGKSILAVQIGDSISRGVAINSFRLEAPKQRVLYFDFELSDKQFEARYSIDYKNHYAFDINFLRAEMNPDSTLPDNFKTYEEFISYSLEQTIIGSGVRILIIDNLTYLSNETERAKDALPLMKHLKALKVKYGLSILCLAHTPKRDMTKPITRNDLQGSKMLINFCDSCFTIGESTQDKQIRYVKQIKERNTAKIYGDDNVVVCQLTKPSNFLHFEFLTYGNERDHLRQQTEEDKSSMIERAKELITQGKSQRTVAAELGISLGAVNKYFKM